MQKLLPMWFAEGYRAQVESVRSESPDVYSLVLKPSRHWLGFKAGQHITITAEKDGAYLSRNFSISSSPAFFEATGTIELSIRVQDGGLLTPWLKEHFSHHLYTFVNISAAKGLFVLPSSAEPLLFIAGGSGVTPFRSMLQQLSLKKQSRDIHLIYYARDADSHLFKQELITIERSFPKLKISFLNDIENGYFSDQILKQVCPDFLQRSAYICGPSSMLSLSRKVLAQLNVPTEQVFFEYFGAVPLDFPRSGETSSLVSFKKSNRIGQFDSSAPKTLLALAEDLGLNPLSGCRAGVCHQCVCRKESGVVYNTLTGKESGTGAEEIQLCVCVPSTDLVLDV
ncbi:MAG: FAD-binding oxidoreductase [Venatoribacter sp.]